MTKRTPLTNANCEVRELSAADLRRFKPAAELLQPDLLKAMGIKPLGPKKRRASRPPLSACCPM